MRNDALMPLHVRFMLLMALIGGVAVECSATEFAYHSPQGTTFRVTEDGLSSIEIGGRHIATGGWSAFNAENWFKDGGSQQVKSDPPGERAVERLSENRARVRQVAGDLVCRFDYIFDGEDVVISSRIENNNQSSPMNIVGFSGPRFLFDSLPTGLMPVQHISYFAANGVRACHPGYWQPVGGTYATDNSVGIGTSPWGGEIVRTLTLWDYTDWDPAKRDSSPERILRYFVVSPVPAGGAATFDFAIRVSSDRDWKHLLQKYRQYFQQTYGPLRYKLDPRFIASEYLNGGPGTNTRDNPNGFRGAARRIDNLFGAQTFCDRTIGQIQRAGGQGIMLWGLAGENPRGAMYRPDFDVLPPDVDYNFAIVARRYKAAGLKLGVATRPRDVVTRLDWNTDTTIAINVDDPGSREMLWKRFSNMIDRGCTLFYLDSFGDAFEDLELMQFLRQKLGPDVLTFAEHQTDAIMPLTGGYSETTFTAGANGRAGSYRLWSDLQNWEIYRWLCPGSQMTGRLFEYKGGRPGAGDVAPDDWFFSHGVTPLVPVDDFASRLDRIAEVQSKYIGGDSKGR
jgi:hypothetical protein